LGAVTGTELDRLRASGVLSYLDVHFAGFLGRLAGSVHPEFQLAAALASSHTRQGHVCLDLSRTGGMLLAGDNDQEAVTCPPVDRWAEILRRCPAVGGPGDYKPLILDGDGRLYLYRYWEYQDRLARGIRERAGQRVTEIDLGILRDGLERLFPSEGYGETDWRKVAAFSALTRRFSVTSGGPGTGKTTTVARLLALLLEQAGPGALRIALTAPTGKAAARLQEAIRRVKGSLDCPENIRESIPEEAATIHRLLGSRPNSPYFRHHEGNPLPLDVVVVDEASMVDLALMSKLVQALGPQARVVLLGDRDQLASVEAGAVLGDICDTGRVHGFSEGFRRAVAEVTGCALPGGPPGESDSPMRDCIVQLEKSYRFGRDSDIGLLGEAVNRGEGIRAAALLKDAAHGLITWRDVPPPHALPTALSTAITRGFEDYLRAAEPWEAFQRFDRFRILCALREGPYGAAAVNLLVENLLSRRRLIEPRRQWYRGRPLMVTRNDYHLRLFNGDVGLVLPDPEAGGDLRVFFPSPDGTLRKFHPRRVPEHETMYATTVHKSQGSEFDRVLLLLPDRDSSVLTRELIYTGISRGRQAVELWGVEEIFVAAVSRRIERRSGLRDALWGPEPA
jgi:exodeoxyribonuclease V alpha subunit